MSKKENPHVTALRKQDKLNRLAVERFRIVNGRIEKYKLAPAQDVERIVADIKKHERLANPVIGEKDERGIFLGSWEPKDCEGVSLRKKFNVFAAPEDLLDAMTYNETARRVAELQNWHGHNGTSYENDGEIRAALQNGSYDGGWFMPVREMLDGLDACYNKGMQDNMLVHHNTGAFKGTFSTSGSAFSGLGYYWSSTQEDHDPRRLAVRFDHASSLSTPGSVCRYRCRLVRLELRP